MIRKTKEIKLLGQRVILSERSASDIFELLNFIEKKEDDKKTIGHQYIDTLYFNARAVSDSLNYMIVSLPFYKFLKKWTLRKKYSPNNLLRELSPLQLTKIVQIIVEELEETNPIKKDSEDPKKKRSSFQSKQSAEPLAEA